MSDVEQERVTALWREAAAALEQSVHGFSASTNAREAATEDLLSQIDPRLKAALAECGRLREQLDAARQAAKDVMTSLDLIGEGDWTPQDTLAHRLARAALGVEGEQEKP